MNKNLKRLLIIVMMFVVMNANVNVNAEVTTPSTDGVRNTGLTMDIIPRGNPATIKSNEKRWMTHTSFESTGLFLYAGEELKVTVEGNPENLELRVGQWGGYST